LYKVSNISGKQTGGRQENCRRWCCEQAVSRLILRLPANIQKKIQPSRRHSVFLSSPAQRLPFRKKHKKTSIAGSCTRWAW
jgi:hypothetical protein